MCSVKTVVFLGEKIDSEGDRRCTCQADGGIIVRESQTILKRISCGQCNRDSCANCLLLLRRMGRTMHLAAVDSRNGHSYHVHLFRYVKFRAFHSVFPLLTSPQKDRFVGEVLTRCTVEHPRSMYDYCFCPEICRMNLGYGTCHGNRGHEFDAFGSGM